MALMDQKIKQLEIDERKMLEHDSEVEQIISGFEQATQVNVIVFRQIQTYWLMDWSVLFSSNIGWNFLPWKLLNDTLLGVPWDTNGRYLFRIFR